MGFEISGSENKKYNLIILNTKSMRKLIFLIVFYFAFSGVGFSQDYNTSGKSRTQLKAMVAELVAEKGVEKEDSILVVLNDTTMAVVPLDSINAWIESMDSTLAKISTVGDVFENSADLVKYSLKIKDGIAVVIKNAPAPNTKEGVLWWVEAVQKLWFAFAGLLTWIVTALFNVIRKNPKVVTTAIGKAAAWVKTRFFVPVAGGVLTLVGLVFFDTNIGAALSIILAIVLAFGIDNIILIAKGFFDKKEEKTN